MQRYLGDIWFLGKKLLPFGIVNQGIAFDLFKVPVFSGGQPAYRNLIQLKD